MTNAEVTVTAMDFAAHGTLRAFVKNKCGGLTEVPGAISIPADVDGNQIADSLVDYALTSPAQDDDATPRGDGTPGDGLTAFEEYRGFIGPNRLACSVTAVTHHRTSPKKKDLFVRVTDPILVSATALFGLNSGLDVHRLCPGQLDASTKIINFTMQMNPGEGAYGTRLTQDWPQYAVLLVNESLNGRQLATARGLGPPGHHEKIIVDVPRVLHAYRNERYPGMYVRGITWHELGHAVNIRHHGDGNIPGPFVMIDTANCPARMIEGTVDGVPACLGYSLAVRHGQNSGSDACPMKYIRWNWFVPPGNRLAPVGDVTFRPAQGWPWTRVRQIPAYRGTVAKYRQDLDNIGLGEFCTAATGRGVNGLPDRMNHAGNSARSCGTYLHVNDAIPVPASASR